MNNESLIKRVESLEKFVRDLHSGNTIPLWLDQALMGRGYVKLKSGGTGSFGTQSITIASTPQTIHPPAQPSGTIAVTIGGTTYNLIFA